MSGADTKSTFNWTRAAVAILNELWADGLSASRISVELHQKFGGDPTRNAVVGKLHRLGLSRMTSRPTTQRKSQSNPTRTAKQRVKQFGGGQFKPVEIPEVEEPVRQLSPDDIPLAQRKQLLELGPFDCRWPYGDVGKPDFFFCGAIIEQGSSYCPTHHHVARGTQPRSAVRPWYERRTA